MGLQKNTERSRSMIGFLRGKIILKDRNYLTIDVCGVGYKVLVASDVLGKVHNNSSLELFIYTHVREDAISLYGFLESADLKLFESLIGVSGIGPKTAMAIFSTANRTSIVEAIVKGDVDLFTSVPRLGRKNAQKIIIELKSKFGSLEEFDLSLSDGQTNEVIIALQNFGYTKKEAFDALKNSKDKGETIEEKIRGALKYLGK